MVSDQEYPKENYILQHALASFFIKIGNYKIVWVITRQCFVFMVVRLTIRVLAAIIGDVSLFHHQSLKLATRLVSQCHTKSSMLTINICIYNQPSKDFAEEDLKVVVVLVVPMTPNL